MRLGIGDCVPAPPACMASMIEGVSSIVGKPAVMYVINAARCSSLHRAKTCLIASILAASRVSSDEAICLSRWVRRIGSRTEGEREGRECALCIFEIDVTFKFMSHA